MKARLAITKCPDYDSQRVLSSVRRAIELAGGIGSFIRPHSKVLVKPNLLMASSPDAGIVTHPEVVRAVIRILKETGCRVYLGDGPSVWGKEAENLDNVYEQTGIKAVARQEQVELVRFDKRRWRGKFPLTTWLDDCDGFVSIPKFKTHSLTTLTAGIKNLYGLVSGTYKTELHKKYFEKEDFAGILVDIYEIAKPSLTVVDAITAMEGEGPGTSGKTLDLGLVLAGSDCLAIDSVLATIAGLKPEDILTNKEAARRGLGAWQLDSIEIAGEKLTDIGIRPFILPAAAISRRMIPKPIVDFLKNRLKFYPLIDHKLCVRCGVCAQICPQKVIVMRNNRMTIDYRNCISCFCCQESCPHAAIRIRKSLVARIAGL